DDWQGYIPYEHRVYSLNPERGFVSSANQHSVSENYPYYTYSGTLEFYRNRRINRLLSEMDSITVGDFMKMHLDSYSIEAEEVLPIFLSAIKTKNYSGVAIDWLKQLNQWDYTYSSTSELPSVFERWWWEFKNILWDEFKNKDVALDFPSSYSTYIFIKNHPHHVLMDNKKTVQTDSLSDLVNMAFDSTIHYFEQLKSNNQEYTWKEYNNVKINHLARIPQFSTNKLSTSGSGSSINAVDGSHGPSLRLIVEMSTPPKAYGIYPGGQSGNPGSPFYENFVESWVQGDYFDLVLDDKEKIKSKATFTQILKPLSK
ncbi:MAG: penicillin acylase family protein, partial [Cyclobacteriaceae bacterium]|nr:penicillin acylase family protein [Cyclobacteriaceae bacterium]